MNFSKNPSREGGRHYPARTRPLPMPEAELFPREPVNSSAALPRMVTEASAFGPEAYERAQMMAYERMTRIQQESPYTATEVVEHVVHDRRLYLGMWVVAGVSAVLAFLTFSLPLLAVTGIATVFGLSATPGRQTKA